MHIVKVSYMTTAAYAARNQENISKVMSELRHINNPGIRYSTFLSADGKSFTHLAIFREKDLLDLMNGLQSFKNFVKELRETGLDSTVSQELLTLVDSSYPVFG